MLHAPGRRHLGDAFSGCTGIDNDFDGPEYQNGTWPGTTGASPSTVSTPITFSSLLFTDQGGSTLQNYSHVAFENDLPRIERADFSTNNDCQRHVSNRSPP